MDYFDQLKEQNTQKGVSQSIDEYVLAIQALKSKLVDLDYNVENYQDNSALIVNSDLEIDLLIVPTQNLHPLLMQVMLRTSHPVYFPKGIIENVVGIGDNFDTKIDSALDNYLNTTFSPIIESFTESHIPELDFTAKINNKDILWHPNLGDLTSQGQWKTLPAVESLFEILKEKIQYKLSNQKFNWLKIYTSKNQNNEIIGECFFNNEHWEEGLTLLSEYTKTWNEKDSPFLAQKQFIMFRRCDIHDN